MRICKTSREFFVRVTAGINGQVFVYLFVFWKTATDLFNSYLQGVEDISLVNCEKKLGKTIPGERRSGVDCVIGDASVSISLKQAVCQEIIIGYLSLLPPQNGYLYN